MILEYQELRTLLDTSEHEYKSVQEFNRILAWYPVWPSSKSVDPEIVILFESCWTSHTDLLALQRLSESELVSLGFLGLVLLKTLSEVLVAVRGSDFPPNAEDMLVGPRGALFGVNS